MEVGHGDTAAVANPVTDFERGTRCGQPAAFAMIFYLDITVNAGVDEIGHDSCIGQGCGRASGGHAALCLKGCGGGSRRLETDIVPLIETGILHRAVIPVAVGATDDIDIGAMHNGAKIGTW